MNNSWEARAGAAEKTVAVLKNKVKQLYNGGQSSLQRQVERARQREEQIRRKQELIEVRNHELRKYNLSLEAEVARRTRALQTILDHVTFGFLIIDRGCVIQEGYTESCHALLNQEVLTGKHLGQVLSSSKRVAVSLDLGIDQIFEDILPEELLLDQLPRRFELNNGRVLRAEGRVVRSEAGAVEGVLMTLSEITELEAAQRESNENKVLIELLRQRESFRLFLFDVRALCRGAAESARCGDAETVRRIVHTIKGNAASFGLADVAAVCHDIESGNRISASEILRVEIALAAFLDRHRGILEMSYDSTEHEAFEVSEQHMSELKRIVSQFRDEHAQELRKWTAAVARKPATALMGPVEAFVTRLAERLEKRIAFNVVGEDTPVDAHVMRPIFQSLSHVLRNAVDHGVEVADERGDKAPQGQVSLQIIEDPSEYRVIVKDDGRGIDVDAVVQRAIEQGLLKQDEAAKYTDEDKLALIFLDGLSTAPTATEISGRGVGMSAVRAAVRSVGGDVHISTSPGAGTQVELRVPKPELQISTAA